MTPDERAARIIKVVEAIPEGFVRSYGDVSPGAPRIVGRVLAEYGRQKTPWQRVVRADGGLAMGKRQRQLLEAEDVPFRGQKVDMPNARLPLPPGEY